MCRATHRLRLAATVLILLIAATGHAQTRVTAAVGHTEPVRAIGGRSDLRFAFSAGGDGKLIVWDLAAEAMYASYQLAGQPLTLLAVHPEESWVAAFVADSITGGRIITIDWVTGERLHTAPIEGRPSSLQYSPRGAYLFVTRESFESLVVLDAATGRDTRLMDDGFGVVSFLQIAPNEQNIMTYVASRGEFIYWSLRAGRELQTVSTEPRLDHMTLIDRESYRYLVASTADELVVVDNLTGAIQSRYPARPVEGITFDQANDRILVLSSTNGRSSILAFEFRSGRLRRASYRPQSVPSETSAIGVAGSGETDALLAGSESGQMVSFHQANGRRTELATAPQTAIVDAVLTNGSLVLSTTDGVLRIQSDLFATDRSRDIAAESLSSEWTTDVPGTGLAPLGTDVLTWGLDQPGVLRTLSAKAPLYEDDDAAPIARVHGTEAGVLVLHRDGRVIRITNGEAVTAYQGRGIQDALWTEGLGLVAAKSRISTFDSSIILVDSETRETVAAATDGFLTTRLALDPDTESVYAIELLGDREDPTARLVRLTGQGLVRSRTILETPEAGNGADILWDPATGALLSTLVEGEVQRVQSDLTIEQFERVERIPTSLATNGRFVVAINRDGTLSVWDTDSRAHLADLYVFNQDWIAIAPNGAFLASSRRAESHLALFQAPGSRMRISDFRVEVPFSVSRN